MSQQSNDGFKAFIADEDLNAFCRVKLSGDYNVSYADAADNEDFDGVTQHDAKDGERVTVKLRSGAGTFKVRCAGAVTQNAVIYAADDGEIDDALSLGVGIGKALEAATTAHDVIECILWSQYTLALES